MNRTIFINILSFALLIVSCGENLTETEPQPEAGRIIVEGPGFFFDNPAWHPDGKWIAVDHGDSIDSDFDGLVDTLFSGIWLINAETGYKQPLIRGFGYPDWSPDGKSLVAESGAQIFTMEVSSLEPARIDSGSILQLTFEGRNFFPAWSPDGEWIAYTYSICGGDSTCGTWLMDTAGDQKLFLFLHGVEYSWHPFEPLILYTRPDIDESGGSLGDSLGLFDIRTNTDSSFRFLSEPNHKNRGSKYSPEGSEIVIYSQPRSGFPATWIFDSDGSSPRQLTDGPDWRFDWSPDGKHIVFLRWNFNEPIEGNGELWVINTDGTNLRQLTFSQ